MFPVAPIITGITLAFTFHMDCISIVRSLYFKIFSASFLITFLSPEIATSISSHVSFSLSQIIMSGLLLGIVLSVSTCWFHSTVTFPPRFITIEFGTFSYQCFLSSCTLFPCICWSVFAHSLYHAVLHIVLLPVLGMLMYGLLSDHVFATVCICYPSLSVVFLWRSTSCLTLGLVLPLFRSQSLLFSLLSIARGMFLLH